MAYNMQSSSAGGLPDISTAPSTTFRAAIVMAGANQGASLPYAAPVTNEEDMTVYHLPAGNTVLTLAIARYDLIVADNPAATTLEIPSEASMSYSRTAARDISFFVQRRGLGTFAVNFTGGTLVEDNDVDPATLPQYHTPVQVCTIGTANQWIFA